MLELSINFGGSTPKVKMKPSITDNDFLGVPEIFFCEGIVYTSEGNGGRGARMIHDAPAESISAGAIGGRR